MEFNGAAPPPPPSAPPLPPLPRYSGGGSGLDLRVSRRLLWVGEAAYPLHNIVRVQTTVLVPNRALAWGQFLKWMAGLIVVFVVLQMLYEESSSSSYDDGNSTGEVLWTIGIFTLICLVSLLVYRLTRPDEHVLTVETAGASVALVTMTDKSRLQVIVQYIVNAIENPAAEFSVRVERLLVNPKSYHYGDTVNVNGSGNIGVSK
ncbi:DUF6232 family protein [Streptomyces sp. NBC_00454]|uniref:DUF6232 family protein n=1 Tax=Streptomyces sp. NBC_00454 TaxID=2975747 RepID=UPI0030E57409